MNISMAVNLYEKNFDIIQISEKFEFFDFIKEYYTNDMEGSDIGDDIYFSEKDLKYGSIDKCNNLAIYRAFETKDFLIITNLYTKEDDTYKKTYFLCQFDEDKKIESNKTFAEYAADLCQFITCKYLNDEFILNREDLLTFFLKESVDSD